MNLYSSETKKYETIKSIREEKRKDKTYRKPNNYKAIYE
jgi:hypothetical protein